MSVIAAADSLINAILTLGVFGMSDLIKEYLEKWDEASSPKPVNDPEFIKMFIDFMKSKDKDHYEFHGENHYCGFTARVYDCEPVYRTKPPAFEFAYGEDFVKVFTAYHNGFWVPEYISLSGDAARPILDILQQWLARWAGFNSLPQQLAKREMELLLINIKEDLKMRAEIDSDGEQVVNLSASLWHRLNKALNE